MKLGTKIKALLAERAWTQARLLEEFARIGYAVSPGYLGTIASNAREAPVPFVVALERVFLLPRGTLLRDSTWEHVEEWCRRTGLTVDEVVAHLEKAMQERRPSSRSATLAPFRVPAGLGLALALS